MMKTNHFELPISTGDGVFLAHYSERGLAGLDFPHRVRASARAVSAKGVPLQTMQWHRQTTKALKEVLSGRPAGELPPLDWTGTTDFQQAVWKEMLKIAPGDTRSYGDVAKAIGRPKAVRAVGGACGANPIPVLVPCHRILAANRRIGGFSGGLDWKRTLLKKEGLTFP